MEDQIQKTDPHPVAKLKGYLSNESVRKRFEEMLGKNAGAFINSVINVYQQNEKLQKCTHESICSSAIRAATFNMPIDPALGFAAIVPYGKQASFQFMYKGITQLCIRTNQYKTIHCSEVYSDELDFYNPITGEVTFKDPKTYKLREKKGFSDVVGHYAHFKLMAGFEKSDYMTTAEAMAHGAKYSAAYKYDLANSKKNSIWSIDPCPMCNKTVLIRLLTKYGAMSIEMQDALIGERETFEDAQKTADDIIDAEAGSKTIDAEKPEEVPESDEKPDWLNEETE